MPLTIIFSGLIGHSGLGGQAWATMQYLVGLRELGYEVIYLEDAGPDPGRVYDWEAGMHTRGLDAPAAYIQSCLEPVGMAGSWIYRSGDDSRGMPLPDFLDACAGSELLIMRAAPVWRKEYSAPRRRAFIDVDPGFTQMTLVPGEKDHRPKLLEVMQRCERHFTVGLLVGSSGCQVPSAGFEWLPTRPPVVLEKWPAVDKGETRTHFTTLMRWRGFRDVEYRGVEFGRKDREFPAYLDLPSRTTQPMRLALIGGDDEWFANAGWDVVSGVTVSRTPSDYQAFIRGSRAEFSVAKQAYVATRNGWASDRTVCYLASGIPAVVGDTGLGDVVPTGRGFVTFRNPSQALEGIEAINSDYDGHRRAAREIAEQWFDSKMVLTELVDAALD